MNNGQQSLQTLKKLFQYQVEVVIQPHTFLQHEIVFIYCESMVDRQSLQQFVIPTLQQDDYEAVLALTKVSTKEQATAAVFRGHLLLFFQQQNVLYSCDIASRPNRQPEQTNTEAIIKGPRDNFIEDLSTNMALVRKRLPTTALHSEKFVVGTHSKTEIAIFYMPDVVHREALKQVKERLQSLQVEIVLSGEHLMEKINERTLLIPRHEYSGRPDFVVQAIHEGRLVLLIDGVAYAVITPVNVLMLIKTSEDNESTPIYASFGRLLRFLCILLGILLPAFWLALTSFHQDQLPFQLLATVVQANTGLPLPSALEMIIMILMFELFREAGARLPAVIGGTFSVVGGIIIGDAAIRAGVTSPAMIVIIAISTIATFTLVNQSLLAAVSLLRLSFVIVTSVFGLFGFFVMLYITLLHIANIRIFGSPYLQGALKVNWRSLRAAFLQPRKGDEDE